MHRMGEKTHQQKKKKLDKVEADETEVHSHFSSNNNNKNDSSGQTAELKRVKAGAVVGERLPCCAKCTNRK